MKTILTDDYLTGIARFDVDHSAMLDYLNELDETMSHAHLLDCLQKTVGEWIFHMMDEEHFMRQIGYPDYPLHCMEHSNLLSVLKEVKYNLEVGSVLIDAHLIDRIKVAMLDHIKDSDVLYGKYYQAVSEHNAKEVHI